MQSQAIFDICLSIGSINNISKDWAPRFNFNISFEVPEIENFPCPYAITQDNQSKWKSSIDLNSYRSDSVQLGPLQEKRVLENCLWRASIPLSQIEDLQLLCFVEFEVEHQVLGSAKFNYSSCIGICCYLPIYSPSLGITISAKIQTQMLGIRAYKNLEQDRMSIIYKGIQNLFNESNRLTHKIKSLQNLKEQNRTIQTISTISPKKEQHHHIQQVSQYHLLYREFQKLKNFKSSRIFRYGLTKEHRHEVCSFLQKLKGQFMNVLQLNWQKYLKFSSGESLKKIQELRFKFVEDFSYQVKNKILRNKSLMKSRICPMSIGQLKSKIEGFELSQITPQLQQVKQGNQSHSLSFLGQTKQILVLVHGLGANSLAMTYIERTVRYIYPHIDILNSTANQFLKENIDLEAMGRNLAVQLLQYIKKYNVNDDYEISFIAHSLGGLVVRAALPYLSVLKQSMNSFITMATPHLGHLQHSNKIAKWGMIALNTLQKSKVIDNLLLKDNTDPRMTALYNLSTQSSLSWFRSVVFYGSEEDGYVSKNSALAIDCSQGFFKTNHAVYEQMVKSINQSMSNIKIRKFIIKFEHENPGYRPDIQQLLLGRSSHLAFPSHQSFINFMLLQNYKNFKQDNISLFEESY